MGPQYLAVAALTLVPGLSLAVGEGLNLTRGLASRRWPVVPGRVRELAGHVGSLHHGDEMVGIWYEYEIDGRQYRSQQIDYSGNATRMQGVGMRETIAQFDPGDAVRVHVDPGNPARSVLHPGISRGTVLRLLFSVALSAVGLFLLVVALLV